MIARAPAQVAFEAVANGLFVQVAALIHQIDGAHDHARRAEAALQGVVFVERRLHRVQVVRSANAFDGGDLRTVGLTGQHRAGLDRGTVEVHHTRTALAGVAADVGAGEAQAFAKYVHQQCVVGTSRLCAVPLTVTLICTFLNPPLVVVRLHPYLRSEVHHESLEESARHLARGTVHQARADLCELAADAAFDPVLKECFVSGCRGQFHRR